LKVLVDTSVWSVALRRSQNLSDEQEEVIFKLRELIDDARVAIIGPIRQEILSGIPEKKQFETLKKKLRVFPDTPLETDDYETAAEFFNTCRRKGIQGSHIDFLICAAASRRTSTIFTLDNDFILYSRHLPVALLS